MGWTACKAVDIKAIISSMQDDWSLLLNGKVYYFTKQFI